MKSKKDISFLIPTNRSHEKYLDKTILTINRMDSLGFDYEILVSSTNSGIDSKNIKYFKDTDNEGSIRPINFLASQANGDYLCVLVDDYLPSKNLFSVINFLQSPLYYDRIYKVTSLSVTVKNNGHYYKLPAELVPPSVIHPITKAERKHNRNYIMKFPTMDRKTYELFGEKIFHPHFLHHVADNYMSIYLGHMGEPTIECREITLWDWAGRNAKTTYDVYDMIVLYNLVGNLNNNYYDKNSVFDNLEDMKKFYLEI